MAISRAVIEVQGGPGGNGVCTFYGLDGAALRAAVSDFASNWSGVLPNDIVLNVPNVGDIINEENGELVGSWADGPVTGFTGTDAGPWVAGVGVRVKWQTAGVVDGFRVQGRTFVVPLSGASFDNEGRPTAVTIDAVGSWATDLYQDTLGNMVVWSRPTPERLGSRHVVVAVGVPPEASFLRSRRS